MVNIICDLGGDCQLCIQSEYQSSVPWTIEQIDYIESDWNKNEILFKVTCFYLILYVLNWIIISLIIWRILIVITFKIIFCVVYVI